MWSILAIHPSLYFSRNHSHADHYDGSFWTEVKARCLLCYNTTPLIHVDVQRVLQDAFQSNIFPFPCPGKCDPWMSFFGLHQLIRRETTKSQPAPWVHDRKEILFRFRSVTCGHFIQSVIGKSDLNDPSNSTSQWHLQTFCNKYLFLSGGQEERRTWWEEWLAGS